MNCLLNNLCFSQIFIRRFSVTSKSRAVYYPKPDYGPLEVQRSELLNGIRVAAAKPLGAQIAACTIMYQAGSRYEMDTELGASHFIRACSGSSGGFTAFSKSRVLQQHGAYINCSVDRQSVAFTLTCPVTSFPELKYYLLDVACRCCFNQWEINDRKPIIKKDLLRVSPEQRVLDLVQRATFAGPLNNSVFCEEDRIEDMTENALNCFTKKNFRSDQCAVASVGVPFEETMKMAEKIEYKREKPPPRIENLSYFRGGFEYFDLGPGAETYIALAVPGCGACEITCLLKYAVVSAACGTSPLATSSHRLDRALPPPLGLVSGADIFTTCRAFSLSYRETGIFGILAKTRSCSAYNVALAAAEFLAHVGDLDFRQIDVGKARLKLDLAINDDDCQRVTEGLALQLANGVIIDSAKNSIAMVDSICNDEISCTAKGLSEKRELMSVAVVGDVASVPDDRDIVSSIL